MKIKALYFEIDLKTLFIHSLLNPVTSYKSKTKSKKNPFICTINISNIYIISFNFMILIIEQKLYILKRYNNTKTLKS